MSHLVIFRVSPLRGMTFFIYEQIRSFFKAYRGKISFIKCHVYNQCNSGMQKTEYIEKI
jgi:hypothetical protein